MNSDKTHTARFVLALFLLSVAAVLFSLALFRMISFFIMPSLFFDLLLIGFPMGAALVAQVRGITPSRFRSALVVMQCVMIATGLWTMGLKHVDYMRENLLFHVNPYRLLVQIVIFAAFYLPFFVAYGAAEYLGYLLGVESVLRRMRSVYAIFLFGGAVAFALAELLLPWGVTRLFVLALGLLTVSRVLLAERWGWANAVELVVLAAVGSWPAADGLFMWAFKSSKPGSVADYQRRGPSRLLHSGWGRYAYVEILEREIAGGTALIGFYNDHSQWVYPRVATGPKPFREQVLSPYVRGAERVAIVGAGGGRDIRLAREAGVAEIVAIELEPQVPRAIQGPLREPFENVYGLPGVRVVVDEARRFFEQTGERFDAIFFWSVGGYAQLMLEPGNMVRTEEAFRTFVEHLSDRGLFIIGYDSVLDPERILLRQYYETLSALGCHVVGFDDGERANEYILLAASPKATAELRAERMRIRESLPPAVRRIASSELRDRRFTPVTDDRPYLGGNIRNILTPEQIIFLCAVLSGVLLVAGACTVAALRGYLRRRSIRAGGSFWLSFLVGANFLVAEHLAILEIFRWRYVYYDALMVGAIGFLAVTGLGSLLVSVRGLRWCGVLGLLVAGLWLGGVWGDSLAARGVSVVWLAFAAGSFFPLLFDYYSDARLAVFAMDAVGAAAGSLVSFFVPILLGFTVFRTVALVVYLVTLGAMLSCFWRMDPERARGVE